MEQTLIYPNFSWWRVILSTVGAVLPGCSEYSGSLLRFAWDIVMSTVESVQERIRRFTQGVLMSKVESVHLPFF